MQFGYKAEMRFPYKHIHDQTRIVHYNHCMPEQTHKIVSHRTLLYIWRHTVNI